MLLRFEPLLHDFLDRCNREYWLSTTFVFNAVHLLQKLGGNLLHRLKVHFFLIFRSELVKLSGWLYIVQHLVEIVLFFHLWELIFDKFSTDSRFAWLCALLHLFRDILKDLFTLIAIFHLLDVLVALFLTTELIYLIRILILMAQKVDRTSCLLLALLIVGHV